MNRVDELQERHDKLIADIELILRMNMLGILADKTLALVNQYGDTCIKLVEAEHAECGS